ncbi:MAG: hypothetical protein WD851_19705 [Pirellulales bacterium]
MRLVKALAGGVIGGLLGAALIIGVEGFALMEAPWLALFVGVLTGLGVRLMAKSDRPGPCYLCGAIAAALTLIAFVGATLATTKMLQVQVERSQIKLPRDRPAPDATPPAREPAEDAAPPAEDLAAEPETPGTDPAATDDPAVPGDAAVPGDPAAPLDVAAPADPAATVGEPGDEAAAEPPAEAPEAEDEVVEKAVEMVAPARPPAGMSNKPPARADEFSLLSFAFIGVGALIAYELGRSSGRS